MAITTKHDPAGGYGRAGKRHTDAGTANAAVTVSSPLGPLRVLFATCVYSGSPTQGGVTFTLNSGAGSTYDALLFTGSANVQVTVFAPAYDLVLKSDDQLDVYAPAGGGALTAAIAIYTEPA